MSTACKTSCIDTGTFYTLLLLSQATQSVSPGLALALENAKKISEGNMNDVEFISGPGDAARRQSILDKAYEVGFRFRK